MSFTLVNVTGSFTRADGLTPSQGEVLFRLTTPLYDPSTGAIVSTDYQRAEMDENGDISLVLTALDDVGVVPLGARYEVTERHSFGRTVVYFVEIGTSDAPTVDLATLVHATASLPSSGTGAIASKLAKNANLADVSDLDAARNNLNAQEAGTSIALPAVAAPAGATGGFYLSQSIAKLEADPSPAGRFPLFYGQEVSVWVANSRYNMINTDGSSHLVYRYCLTSDDPTVAANWTAPTTVIGGGAGGWATTAARSYVYVEGSTLYLYFCDLATGNVKVATAAISAPTVFTTQVAVVLTAPTSMTGNICVVKDGSTYRMFLEVLHTDTLPGEGVSNTFQIIALSCATATGTFVSYLDPVASLRPGPNAGCSGMWMAKEGSTWVAYYHGQTWGRSFPSSIFRATTTDLTTDSWTVTNGSRPLMKRSHPYEVDQIADPFLCQSPGGTWFLFYEGADNRSPNFEIMVVPLHPMLESWDGARWQPAARQGDPRPADDYVKPFLIQNLPAHDYDGARRSGTWTYDPPGAGVIGDARRYNTTAAQNDSIEFDVILPPGTYQLRVIYSAGANHGIRHIDIDDGAGGFVITELGTIDEYSAGDVYNLHAEINFTIYGTETIRRSLRFKASTKNASSSAYYIMDNGWQIKRTDV